MPFVADIRSRVRQGGGAELTPHFSLKSGLDAFRCRSSEPPRQGSGGAKLTPLPEMLLNQV
jgi:hypothetical protein